MKKILLLIVVLILIFNFNSSAQYLQFVENKGQWDNSIKFKADFGGGEIYISALGYTTVLHNKEQLKAIAGYFGAHTITPAEPAKSLKSSNNNLILHSHAYAISFLHTDTTVAGMPDKALSIYNNYFIGKDSTKWKSGCKIYNGITYKNIYRNIDVRYYSDNGNLKYDIIIRPGADITKLAMQVDGADGLSINKYGNLSIKTSVGEIYQSIPFSYQVINNNRNKVKASFVVQDNIVRFKLDKYDKTSTLVIDPTEIFSTFTGSISDNWGYTATYDGAENFYAGGIVFGTNYNPKHVGGYDQTYSGGDGSEGGGYGYDMALIKFEPFGKLALYATYLGGTGDEQPHSLIVDSRGSLVISGRTSSKDYPVTQPTYGSGGGFDICLTRLSEDGKILLASRKFGGSKSDGVNVAPKYVTEGIITTRRNYGDDARSEVITDNQDNIYLASCTQSSDFPTTSNAFKKNLSGDQDGVFIKVSSDLSSVAMSTLIGGNNTDATFALCISNTTNNVYIAGGTNSTDLAFNATDAAQGIVHSSYQKGDVDGFVTEISANMQSLIKTVYIGTTGNDMVYGVQTDKYGYPYITGTTTNAFPVYQSAFNANGNQTDGKQFITKLNADLTQIIYSANFGSKSAVPNISPTAFLVDVCGNAYVSGWGGKANGAYYGRTQTTVGMSTTANAIFRQTVGNNFYFFVLEKNAASQLYGSYFGQMDADAYGDHVDGGTSRFDKRGVIYQAICANCLKAGTVPFPTTTGSWSPGNLSQEPAQCNEAAVKIAFELSGVISSIRTTINRQLRDSSGCIPLTVNFTDTIALGKKYQWDFGDGNNITTTSPNTQHTYNNIGDYKVRLISIDSSKCNIADTSYITIRARDNRAQVAMNVVKLLPCESFNYQFNNTSVPPNGFTFQADDFTWDFGDGTKLSTNAPSVTHQYVSSGVYNIKLYLDDTTFCNSPDSATYQLRVASVLKAQFETPPTGCAPYNAYFNNTSLGGQNFTWDFGDGSTSTEAYPTHTYNNPGTYTIKLKATDNLTCNPESDTSFTITVNPGPIASFIYTPTTPVENTPFNFTNTSTGAIKYKWEFGDGDSLQTSTMLPVSHIYNASASYTVYLFAYNQYGCVDTASNSLTAIVTPLIDVPNAFSPNGDGTNDIIYVKGYGISKMTWKIFNRWGQLMFTSSNINNGWDGKFKGTMQPQDVYAYILNINFTDGTSISKKGDITLLR